MPAVFDLTARLQSQGVDKFALELQRKLRGINAKVDINTGGAVAGTTNLISKIATLEKQLSSLRREAGTANASLKSIGSSTDSAASALENFAAQAGLASRRFIAFTVAAGSLIKIAGAIRDGVKSAIDFDLAMNKLAQVSGETGDRIAAVRGEITKLSTSLGVSSNELAQVAVTLKQAGLSAVQVKQGLEAIALTDLAPNFDSMKQTTEGVIAVYKQFNVQAKDFKAVLGSINAVAGDFAVEAGDLVTAVQKAGGAFAAVAGQSKPGIEALAEFQGLFTSVRATTRESADTIATGLRTIFTRFQRNDTVAALKEFGVNLRFTREEAKQLGDISLENQFVGAFEAVKRLSGGLKDLRETDPRFSAIVEQLGGYRQISKVIPLLQQFGEAQKGVNTALAGQISLQIAAEKRQESLSNKLVVLKENYLAVIRTIVESKGFEGFANSLLSIANGFAFVLEKASPLLPIIAALGAANIAANIGSIYRAGTSAVTSRVGSSIRRASGGFVPGSGDSDSVEALLTPGEFVINKRSAAAIGAANLQRLNRYNKGGPVQKFADGGPVGVGADRPFNLNAQQEKLLAANLSLVEKVIRKLESGSSGGFVKRLGDEAQSTGTIALARAAQDFNEGGEASFKTFATRYIRTAIKDETRKIFGDGGSKAGADKLDLTAFASKELEPSEELEKRRFEEKIAKQSKLAEAVTGGELPKNYKELQQTAKGLGIKSGGVKQEDLTNIVAEAIRKPLQEVSFENIIGDVAKTLAPPAPRAPITKTDFGGRSYNVQVGEREVVKFAQAFKLNYKQFVDLTNDIKELANESGQLSSYMKGASKAIVRFEKGLTPQVLGFAGENRNVDKNPDITSPSLTNGAGNTAAVKANRELILKKLIDSGKEKNEAEILLRNQQYKQNPIVAKDKEAFDFQEAALQPKPKRTRTKQEEIEAKKNSPEAVAERERRKLLKDPGNYNQSQAPVIRGENGPKYGRFGEKGSETRAVAVEKLNQYKYQQEQLNNAKAQQGDSFGVPLDGSQAAARAEGAAGLIAEEKFRAEQERRQSSRNFVDPLITARDTRSSRTRSAKEKGLDANATDLTDFLRTSNSKDKLDDAIVRGIQRKASANPLADPLEVKEAALKAIRAGEEPQAILDAVGNILSPTQKRQIQLQAEVEDRRNRQQGQTQTVVNPNAKPGLVSRARGVLGSISGGTREAFGSLRSGFGSLNERASNSRLGRFASGGGGLGALIAAPLLADQFDKFAGSASVTGDNSVFRTSKAASGGLQGAALGAGVGVAFGGPIGAAVGGVVGGLTGLVSALSDASQEIRQVKINNALSNFQDKLSGLASGNDGSASAIIKKSLEDYRRESTQKNISAATGTVTGFDFNSFAELQKKSTRQDFGNNLAGISQSLQNDADKIGRSNIGKNVDELASAVAKGNGGLNEEFIRIIADLRQIPIGEVQKEIRKNILSAQSAQKNENQSRITKRGEERDVNTFGRLLLAVQGSADSLLGLRQSAQGLSELFDGTLGFSRVSSRSENLDQLGRLDRGALNPLDIVAAVGGQQGAALRNSGGLIDDLSRVLPVAIATAIAAAPDNPETDIATAIGRQLRTALADNPSNQKLINSINSRVSEETSKEKGGNRNFLGQAETDTTELTRKLLQGLADPIKDVGGKVAKQLEDNANQLVEGLSQTANRIRQIGEVYDQLAEVQAAGFRQNLQFSNQNSGRSGQGISRTPLSTLESSFDSRQFRLAGQDGLNPEAIAKRLAETNSRLPAAIANQQRTFERTGGKGGEFKAAAEEVLRLKNNSANLVQALKNLTDVTNRNVVAQEKLNGIQQEREGRRGLAERFVTASPEESARLNRGLLLANKANNQGSFKGLSREDIKLVIETFKGLGNVELTGFKGSPRADDALNRLLDTVGGGAFKLDPAKAAEERQLQNIIGGRNTDAAKAVEALIKNQEGILKTLDTNLTKQQNDFFSKLEQFLQKEQLNAKINKVNELAVEKQKLGGLAKSRDLLGNAGVVNQEQVNALVGKKGDLENIRALNSTRASTADSYLSSLEKFDKGNSADLFGGNLQISGKTFNEKVLTGLFEKLKGFGLTDAQAGESINRFKESTKLIGKTKLAQEINLNPEGQNGFIQVKKILREAVVKQMIAELDKTDKDISESTGKLGGIKGINPDKVGEVLGGPNGGNFIKALESFTDSNKLENLQSAIDKTTNSFNALIKEIPGGIKNPGIAEVKAAGGIIGSHPGSPVGTDTVPAWLTPGEFVVNARDAQANLSLLKDINSGGSSYFAAGGRARKLTDGQFSSITNPFSDKNLGRGLKYKTFKNQAGNVIVDQLDAVGQRYNTFENLVLNKKNLLANSTSRPGDEGQKNVAAKIAAMQEENTRSNFRNNSLYQARLQNKVKSTRFASGGIVGGSSSAQRFNRGGAVHLANGGSAGGSISVSSAVSQEAIGAFNQLSSVLNNFVQQIGGFGQVSQQLAQSFNVFAGNATALSEAISNMPRSLSIQGQHQVVVTINGAEVLSKISPEISRMVTDEVSKSMRKVFKEQMPDAGVQV